MTYHDNEKESLNERIDIAFGDIIGKLPLVIQIIAAFFIALPLVIYMGLTRNKHN